MFGNNPQSSNIQTSHIYNFTNYILNLTYHYAPSFDFGTHVNVTKTLTLCFIL